MQYNIIDCTHHAVHYIPIRHKLALIARPSPQFRTELSVLSLYSSTKTVANGETPGRRSSRFNHSKKGTSKVKERIGKYKSKPGQLNSLKTSSF